MAASALRIMRAMTRGCLLGKLTTPTRLLSPTKHVFLTRARINLFYDAKE